MVQGVWVTLDDTHGGWHHYWPKYLKPWYFLIMQSRYFSFNVEAGQWCITAWKKSIMEYFPPAPGDANPTDTTESNILKRKDIQETQRTTLYGIKHPFWHKHLSIHTSLDISSQLLYVIIRSELFHSLFLNLKCQDAYWEAYFHPKYASGK